MSGSSDSEEFFDAEDELAHRGSRKNKSHETSTSEPQDVKLSEWSMQPDDDIFLRPANPISVVESDKLEEDRGDKGTDRSVGRRRFRELRQRMQTEDDDIPVNGSPPDSQTSSIDGVYPTPAKTSHPFRIIEHDALSLQSMTSLGRVGRILAGVSEALVGSGPSSSGAGSGVTEPPPNGSGVSSQAGSGPSSQTGSGIMEPPTGSGVSSQAGSGPPSQTGSGPPSQAGSASTEYKAGLTITEPQAGYSQPVQTGVLPSFQAGFTTQAGDEDSASGRMSNSSSILTLSGDVLEDEPDSEPERVTMMLQEPDVIASTKNNGKNLEGAQDAAPALCLVPVAPPRRKKKSKTQTPTELTPPVSDELVPASALPSPASTIESITREFEHSLDIRSATKGQYVVKPQDEDKSKAEGPSSEELARVERMKSELLSIRSSEISNSPIGSISSNSIGRCSLGPHRLSSFNPQGSRERRKSAGDQDMVKQLNMFVRTMTDSGKRLTDMEILEQVTVLNLDTGERIPLSIAEDKLPQCINPLSLHIMRITSEYISNSSLDKEKESDEESVDSKMSTLPRDEAAALGRVRKKTQKIKRFLGSTVKKTMSKAKSIAHARHKEDIMDIVDDVYPGEQQYIKLKASNSHKGPYEFDSLQHVQDLSGEHVGPVWCMKFSTCGRLLATAGQDRVVRIWVLRDAFTYFQDMRTKYNAEKVSPTPSQESLVSQQSQEDPKVSVNSDQESGTSKNPFMPKPFCTYTGHTSDLLDVSWSKNYFVLSSSMDKTVRLWHISRKECLCCFQHIDFVTAIVFHPRDDRYFLSGSLDGKLRLWNIPDKKVAVWNEVDGQTKLITAANFCQNGKFAVVGSYDGRCIFYNTEQLKYHTQIHVRSTRGKNSTGRKISGIEPMPGEDKILVTSNDSRIRLYDLRDLNLSCKYKGYVNVSSQIKASFSPDGQYIVSGSENQCIYIWKTHHDYAKFSSARRDRNDFWEGIKAHNAVVTCAVFAPNPDSIIRQIEARESCGEESKRSETASTPVDPVVEQRTKGCGGHVLVSADFNGCIKVFLNKTKPKHSSLPASALA